VVAAWARSSCSADGRETRLGTDRDEHVAGCRCGVAAKDRLGCKMTTQRVVFLKTGIASCVSRRLHDGQQTAWSTPTKSLIGRCLGSFGAVRSRARFRSMVAGWVETGIRRSERNGSAPIDRHHWPLGATLASFHDRDRDVYRGTLRKNFAREVSPTRDQVDGFNDIAGRLLSSFFFRSPARFRSRSLIPLSSNLRVLNGDGEDWCCRSVAFKTLMSTNSQQLADAKRFAIVEPQKHLLDWITAEHGQSNQPDVFPAPCTMDSTYRIEFDQELCIEERCGNRTFADGPNLHAG